MKHLYPRVTSRAGSVIYALEARLQERQRLRHADPENRMPPRMNLPIPAYLILRSCKAFIYVDLRLLRLIGLLLITFTTLKHWKLLKLIVLVLVSSPPKTHSH